MRNAASSPNGRPTARPILSQTAEHALRAALLLARRRAAGPVSAGDVAAALGTPPNYTSKTLRKLARKGLLRSTRGPSGGFTLDVEPDELSVAGLLEAVEEGSARPAVCLMSDAPCDAKRPCGAHRRWSEVQALASEPLERTTLADLLGEEAITSSS